MQGLDERFAPPARFAGAFDRLHELAAQEAGSSAFGDARYRLGLRVLLESMDFEPHFTERGRTIAWGLLVNTLAARARAEDAMGKVAGLDAIAIPRPVVIVGLHRTGTTALHKLLAADPRFQGLEGWLTGAPKPRPPRDRWDRDPLFRQYVAELEARFASQPGLRAAHDMAAEEVEECGNILAHSFTSIVWTLSWSAFSYDAWWQGQSQRFGYQYLARVLRMIGSNDPGGRWLLKHPPHLANLDLLFEVFPDARVIQTHRDPGKAIPSLCSLVMKGHALMETDRRDQRMRLMGYRETARAAKALRDAEPVRRAHADQVMDVLHRDFHARPIDVVRRIYAFIGVDLTPEVEAAMRRRVSAEPAGRLGDHRYDAEDFGLSAAEIREQLGDYVQRFDLAAK